MKKNIQIKIVISCVVICVAIILMLYSSSPLSEELQRADFVRNIISQDSVVLKSEMDIGYNSFYFAGNTNGRLFLGNPTSPFFVLITNSDLADTQHVHINVSIKSVVDPSRFKIVIDSPFFFMFHGVMPEILRGEIDQWNAGRFLRDSANYFVDVFPISPSSFIFRSYSLANGEYELAKKSDTEDFRFNFDLLKKQVDGLFCVDGQLHYSKYLNKIIYLYRYRNEFIVADTNINLSFSGNTLDTFSRARIKVASVGKIGKSMMSSPPLTVNIGSCVWKRYLFVQSNILSKNENIEDFISKTILDVYEIDSGRYLKSFYIENFKNEKVNHFSMTDDGLFVLQGKYLLKYQVPTTEFDNLRNLD